MTDLYKIKELIKPNFPQRLFKKEPKENAIIEVNNLLALKPIKEIKLEEIVAISEKYKVDLRKKFIDRLNDLYLQCLTNCLSDNILDNNDLVELNHLKTLLMLEDSEVEELHNQLSGEIYEKSYNDVISDGKMDNLEEEFLDKLKENLRLPTIIEEKISTESRRKFMQKKLDSIIADRRISPDEWEEFTTIAKNLDVTPKYNDTTREQIEKFKLYWLIENGELPIKEISINLQKNEHCYFTSNADWLESRTITKRINYGGPYARIKIVKGLYYRAGSLGYEKVTSEQVQLIDSGEVYITNKRIIFVGNKKNTSIPLTKILSLKPYSDGVGIEKDTGRSPIICVPADADLLTMILGRVISDLQAT